MADEAGAEFAGIADDAMTSTLLDLRQARENGSAEQV